MITLSNGRKIPKLGLGTYLMTDDEETKQVVIDAFEVGYRHIDTAQMYRNEHAIGEALREVNVPREEYYITTKLARHHNMEKTRELIYESLEKLQTDYIDLCLIHWPNHDDEINANTWKVLEEFYEKGLIKSIGVSNFTRYQLDQLLKTAKVVPHVNQVELHVRLSQVPLRKYLKEKDIQPMSYGPLMKGDIFKGKQAEVLEKIGKRHNASIAQVAIAWGLAQDILMIPKTVTKSRLIENFNAKDIKLTKEEIEEINQLNGGRRYYGDPANNNGGTFIE